MDIKKKLNTLELGNEYGSLLSIRPDKYATEDDSGAYVYHDSVEFYMMGYDEENAPSVEKTLTFEQLKALADYLNARIAEIESKQSKQLMFNLDYGYIEVISVIHFKYSNYPFKFSLLSGLLVAREPIKAEIELTIQQTKNSNDPKLKQQALDLERKIQEKENAKL